MDLELTRIFVKVVQKGSFSRAAELLRVPKSTVSKSVSRLEAVTGTKLLLRTTRSLTLTAAGRAFYDTCLGPIHILEDAQKSLHGTDSIVSGTVRITAPEDLGSHVISGAVGELVKQHPGLAFDLLYTDQVVDLVKDGFDMAVRIGRPRATRFKIRRLGEVVLGLVASNAYLKSAEKISKPENLTGHSCITLDSGSLATRWHLKSKSRSVEWISSREL